VLNVRTPEQQRLQLVPMKRLHPISAETAQLDNAVALDLNQQNWLIQRAGGDLRSNPLHRVRLGGCRRSARIPGELALIGAVVVE
jgi:hypothetical protein